MQSLAVARLSQLTYNLNAGKGTPPLKDIHDFLPYSKRFEIVQQLSSIKGVSAEAAKDYIAFKKSASTAFITAFTEWNEGLEYLAKNA